MARAAAHDRRRRTIASSEHSDRRRHDWTFAIQHKEAVMKNPILPQIYLYDFRSLFVRVSFAAANAFILYSVLFGSL